MSSCYLCGSTNARFKCANCIIPICSKECARTEWFKENSIHRLLCPRLHKIFEEESASFYVGGKRKIEKEAKEPAAKKKVQVAKEAKSSEERLERMLDVLRLGPAKEIMNLDIEAITKFVEAALAQKRIDDLDREHLFVEISETLRQSDPAYFTKLAKWGCLLIAKWAADHFNLQAEDIRARNNEVLATAIQYGNAAFLLFLQKRFGLTVDDLQQTLGEPIEMAASSGYVDVFIVLHEHYGLRKEDMLPTFRRLFIYAAINNRVDILRMLHKLYGLRNTDVTSVQIPEAFINSAQRGHLEVLKVLDELYEVTTEKSFQDLCVHAFMKAARRGHAKVLELLYKKYRLRKKDVDKDRRIPRVLRRVIRGGHIDVLAILYELYGFRKSDFKSVYVNEYDSKIVDVLKILHDLYGFDKNDIKTMLPSIFTTPARWGYSAALKILREDYLFDETDARSYDNMALFGAAQNGHVNVLKMLATDFGLTKVDAQWNGNAALFEAARNGRVGALKTLHEVYHLNKIDAQSNHNQALASATWIGHLGSIRTLHDVYNLDKEDVIEANAINLAARGGNPDVFRLLFEVYQLTAKDIPKRTLALAALLNRRDMIDLFKNLSIFNKRDAEDVIHMLQEGVEELEEELGEDFEEAFDVDDAIGLLKMKFEIK